MILLLPFFNLNAQTYCVPTAGGTSQTYYLKSASLSDQGAMYYDTTSYQAYVDNSSKMVTSYPGSTVNVHFESSTTSLKFLVWIDWNNDGDFDDFYENPVTSPTQSVVNDVFFIPPSQATGIYRIRIETGSSLPAPVSPCGNNPYGNFVDFSLKVDPAPACYVPTGLTAANITNSAAALSWEAPTSASANGYEYYYSSTTTPPDNTTVPSGSSTTTSANINGLTSLTQYYFYSRSVCSSTSKSAWSLRGTFKTKCDPMTSMFENFDTTQSGAYNATCWDRIVLGSGYQTISSNGVNGTKGMYQYASNIANTAIAVLPAFSNVNAGTNWLRFKARVGSAAGVLNVGYVTNDADASTFVNIQSVNISNTVYPGYEYTVMIPTTVPANARLAIRHAGTPAVNIYWDEVYWEPKPTCLPITNLTASNPTSTSTDIAWTASPSSPAGYDIYYSLSNASPTAATLPNITNVTANPYTIQNLEPGKTHYIWVRARCSSTDQGPWSTVTSVLTNCAPVSTLSENFDSYTPGLITNVPCWKGITVGYSDCIINGGSPAASGTKQVFQTCVVAGDISIAVLPEFSNVSSGTHRLKFKARSSVNTGKLKVGYVTDPTNAASFVLIQQLDITNTAYNANYYTVNIPNTVPANARLAIRNDFETSGDALFYWDDLSWEAGTLGTNEAENIPTVTVYPNPFTDTINISDYTKVSSLVVYDSTGRQITMINNPSSSVSLKNLSSGMYMIKMVFKNGTNKTIKAVKK
ncbi:hypothetical protein AMQ68_04300 [Chryseobacterium sp. ERMR1:04]|nr:hypothetical protein AMQ68_04300 [Chryseobacterium sp. ERMR1:04]